MPLTLTTPSAAARRRPGRPRLHRWSEPELRAACASATSVAQVLDRFGIRPSAAVYTGFYRDVAAWAIPIAHFRGQAHRRGLRNVPVRTGRPFASVLVAGIRHNRTSMKSRLIREQVLAYICFGCANRGEWQGRPLSLHLDHINGDGDAWRLENLRFACPNCHAQTATYSGKNKALRGAAQRLAEAVSHRPPSALDWPDRTGTHR